MGVELENGVLCFTDTSTGDTFELNTECAMIYDSDIGESETHIYIPVTITFNGRFDRLAVLSLIHGRKITNNWLKMHGGVMIRKSKGRKKKNIKRGKYENRN